MPNAPWVKARSSLMQRSRASTSVKVSLLSLSSSRLKVESPSEPALNKRLSRSRLWILSWLILWSTTVLPPLEDSDATEMSKFPFLFVVSPWWNLISLVMEACSFLRLSFTADQLAADEDVLPPFPPLMSPSTELLNFWPKLLLDPFSTSSSVEDPTALELLLGREVLTNLVAFFLAGISFVVERWGPFFPVELSALFDCEPLFEGEVPSVGRIGLHFSGAFGRLGKRKGAPEFLVSLKKPKWKSLVSPVLRRFYVLQARIKTIINSSNYFPLCLI